MKGTVGDSAADPLSPLMPSRTDLIRLLTAYRARSEAEGAFRLRMLDLAAAANDPFSRYDYRPGHFTASAFVAHPGGASVLVVHHRKLGFWVQPGGHIDPDDASPLDAAAREAVEEAGVVDLRPILEGPVHLDVHTFPETSDQPEHLHFDLRFGFVAGGTDLSPSDEVHEVKWVAPADLTAAGAHQDLVEPISRVLG